MGLRGLLKKKDKDGDGDVSDDSRPPTGLQLHPPEFTFIRSDTYTEEVIHPPSDERDRYDDGYLHTSSPSEERSTSRARRSLDVFKSRSRSQSTSGSQDRDKDKDKNRDKRLSHRLHLSRSPSTSSHVPADLPEIVVPPDSIGRPGIQVSSTGANGGSSGDGDGDGGDNEAAKAKKTAIESQWEKRATILALSSDNSNRSRSGTPELQNPYEEQRLGGFQPSRQRSASVVSSKEMDADIQEAIRLHEEGQLEASTRMFGVLADPKGYNNPLSQVLYGLALRHGWGCTPDTEAAVKYLSAAASNAATVESLALQAGLKKGGAAKGELVLAIFELANCFRHGWGIEKDPIAAKQYYETAANLGDTDAMNEIAWCYLEGFGCKKDKFASAKYYRLAEQSGNKTLGNSWIWKDKYDPDNQKKKK